MKNIKTVLLMLCFLQFFSCNNATYKQVSGTTLDTLEQEYLQTRQPWNGHSIKIKLKTLKKDTIPGISPWREKYYNHFAFITDTALFRQSVSGFDKKLFFPVSQKKLLINSQNFTFYKYYIDDPTKDNDGDLVLILCNEIGIVSENSTRTGRMVLIKSNGFNDNDIKLIKDWILVYGI